MLSQIPVTNPMGVAMVLSLLVAAFSAPQPPSLPLPGVWGEMPSFEFTKGIRRAVSKSSLGPLCSRLHTLWTSARKDGRPKTGGARGGVPAVRGKNDKGVGADREGRAGKDGKDGGPGRPEKLAHAGRGGHQEGRTQQPACFLCLDRPSRYILEPCGHRVVCGECAVQLVEGAARNRAVSEGAGAHHGSSEKSGGACPSCGQAITRAMRVFS